MRNGKNYCWSNSRIRQKNGKTNIDNDDNNEENDKMEQGNVSGRDGERKKRIERKKLMRIFLRRKSSLKPGHALGMFIIMVVLATSETKPNTKQ